MTTASPELVVSLGDPRLTSPDTLPRQLGGKGASLQRLVHQRFPVPSGFVITTEAYERSAARILGGLTHVAAIRDALMRAELPEDVLGAIQIAYDHLCRGRTEPRLAVRSSAFGEDEKGHTFAGQQASFLGVVGFDSLIEHVRRVWASLFRDEASLYRSQLSLEMVPPSMAVVVQDLVEADRAGVCFTVNPVSGAVGEVVVSAAFGLGATVVGGGESDTYYLRKSDGIVLRREIADKIERVVPSAEGTATRPLSIDEQTTSSLAPADLSRITSIAAQIEDALGAPQDIEWAFDAEGGLWLLQARPIATPEPDDDASVWTSVNVGEALPGVGSPMTWSIIRAFSRRGFETAFAALGLDIPDDYQMVDSFHGRVYLNLTEFAAVITQIPLMKPQTLVALAGGPSVDEIEGTYARHSAKSFLIRLPLTLPKMLASHVTVPITARRWAKRFRRRRDTFFRRRLDNLKIEALAEALDEVDRVFDKTGLAMLSASSNFLSSYVATSALLRRWGGSDAAMREHQLFSGLTDMRSAEPGLAILRMAHTVRANPPLEEAIGARSAKELAGDLDALVAHTGGSALRRQLVAFQREYGHRAPREAELATPRWREDPTFVFEMIKTYLSAPFMADPDELERERARARAEITEGLRPYFATGFGLVFRMVLGISQDNARLREDLRSCVVDTLSMYRHLFKEVGRRLVVQGVLESDEDIFFLTYAEVRQVLARQSTAAFPARVAMRRALYEAFVALPDPPQTFLLSQGRVISTEPEPTGPREVLDGLPASPGRVTARARVILNPGDAGAKLVPGEILVAPFTDVGWTPLFLAASGVVMVRGGPLSHSSIVAREYGIPAAVNVRQATTLIKTGDVITVDGDSGKVYLTKGR